MIKSLCPWVILIAALPSTCFPGAVTEQPTLDSSIAKPGSPAPGLSFEAKKIVQSEIPPAEIIKKTDGHYFIAFEKAGFATLKVKLDSKKGGEEVIVHLGETTSEDHTVHREPGATIRYRRASLTCNKGEHWYSVEIPPDGRNTKSRAIKMPDHIGEVVPFRFAELEGIPGTIDKDDVRMVMAHYPFDDGAAAFESSNEVLNAVWDMCHHTIKATSFCGIYVDGDRERIPYEADAYINQLSHYAVDPDPSMARTSIEYFFEHPTWPTEWPMHMILMAWADYMQTGNADLLRTRYEELDWRTLRELAREDGLISTQEQSEDLLKRLNQGSPMRDIVDWPRGERDEYDFKPYNTVINAFHYRTLVLMSRIASVLEKEQEAVMFREQAEKVADVFNKVFWDEKAGLYRDGEGSDHHSLHANMFALAFQLVPEQRQDSVLELVKSKGMACSVYGAQYLLEALYLHGEHQHALDLMRSKDIRSWWNMIEVGSTIALEAWDRKFKSNLDWNHAWGTVPLNILPNWTAGIRPMEPGWSKILIQPRLADLEHLKLKHPTPQGPVLFESKQEAEGLALTIEFSRDVTGRLELPLSSPAPTTEIEWNGNTQHIPTKNGWLILDLDPGRHQIRIL